MDISGTVGGFVGFSLLSGEKCTIRDHGVFLIKYRDRDGGSTAIATVYTINTV